MHQVCTCKIIDRNQKNIRHPSETSEFFHTKRVNFTWEKRTKSIYTVVHIDISSKHTDFSFAGNYGVNHSKPLNLNIKIDSLIQSVNYHTHHVRITKPGPFSS